MSKAKPKTKKVEIGKVHEASYPKSGYETLGAYKGRKRPDGLGRGWQ